ncbi:MAG: mannose-phosphate guanylyltransferase [Clostridia bacterium]|nr:mannose-phosphate guanylyltransferase [Clostridia bacterium]
MIALVLAGGRGNRFWPKSSPDLPKQFLTLGDSKSLLQKTVERLWKLVQTDDIYIVIPEKYKEQVKMQLPEMDEKNLIIEPVTKDTAVAIGYASMVIAERYETDPVMVVVPSDHLIDNEENWVNTLKQAVQLTNDVEVVTVGITPTRPETEYGYIILGKKADKKTCAYFVKRFIEKPQKSKAESLLKSGNCLWNSGMFIWKLSTLRSLVKKYLPELYTALEKIKNFQHEKGCGTDLNTYMKELFASIPAISIDYGIVEKCRNIIVVEGNFSWDDLGDWRALKRNGLCRTDNVLSVNSSGCIVDWDRGPVMVIGVDNLVIAGSDDGLLVCAEDMLNQIKKVLNSEEFLNITTHLKKRRRDEYKNSGTMIEKPWGREIIWAQTQNYAAKILIVAPGEATSVHLHKEKEETFYIESGTGFILLGEEVIPVKPGKVIHVKPNVSHRIMASEELVLFEVSTSHLDDVIRLNDRYGREKKEGGWIKE